MHSRISNSLLKAALLCVAMIFSLSVYAQNSFTVKAKLADEKTGEPVGFATASLTVKGEKVIIAGGSDRALQAAYTYFESNFIDATNKTVAVPKDLNYTGTFKTREEQLAEVRLVKYPEYPEENLPRNYDYTVRVKQGSETIEIPVYNPVFADGKPTAI